ncbi:PQQ-like beta-propeller repeat protein, partial [bacterium]|nr:PQQ-like beta-propeller repeat protein [bacterium]
MVGSFRSALMVGILVLIGLIASSASFAQGDVWPTYLYDARNSGQCPWVGPDGPFMKWTYPGPHGSSVTIATDGTLRFTAQYEQQACALYPDGSLWWTYELGGGGRARCTPAIASDSSIIAQSEHGDVYRLDKEGGLVWAYAATGGGSAITSPVIADDLNLVFFLHSMGTSGKLHAVYMSGAGQGTAAWTEGFSDDIELDETSPAFDGDTVYVTGRDTNIGSGALKAVEASTGTVLWTYPPGGGIDDVTKSSPSISEDGKFIYFGDDGDTINEAVLYCVASDGTLEWSWDSPVVGAGVLNAPAIGTDGTVYIVDTEANLFAIASDGTLEWQVQLVAATTIEYASVIIDVNGSIYVTASGGLFFEVTPLGRLCWSYDLGYSDETWLSAGSIGTDGTLYFATYDGLPVATVYAYQSGNWLANPSLSPMCGSSSTIFEFTADCAFPPTVGTLLTVQAHLDDGSTVIDLYFDSGVTWIGTVSSLAAGPYQYYLTYETWGGATGTYPETTWLDAMDVDNTAPTSTSWCSTYHNSSPIPVGFESDDYFTGVTGVSLWGRHTSDCTGQSGWGDWTFLMSTDSTVGVFMVPWTLQGRIQFLTIAEDCANIEPKSTPDDWTIYDDTAPVTTVNCPDTCVNDGRLRVEYSIEEDCAYDLRVELWYRYDDGPWTFDTRESGTGSEGFFNFVPPLDGKYQFGCVSTDSAGNDEATPGSICTTLYDTTTPTSIVTDAPDYDTDGSFNVDVSGNDSGVSPNMSGVYFIYLLYQFEGGAWQYDGNYSTSCNQENIAGAVPFTATHGDGVYGFYTMAWDCCSNSEAYPSASTPPDMETIVDTTPPRSRAISPEVENDPNTILVDYIAYDETSGIDYVQLYYNFDGGAWTLYAGAGNTQTGDIGTFPFAVGAANGVYGFYTVAHDKAGLIEATPVDGETPPDCTTVYDDEPPVSTPLTCEDASVGTLVVAGASLDNLSGIASTFMFYRKEGGAYMLFQGPPAMTDWLSAPTRLGYAYCFVPDSGDGEYEFYFIAEDVAGNYEAAFGGGTITALWDTTPPESSCWADSHYDNSTTQTLHYTGADATMDVDVLQLYYRYGETGSFYPTGATIAGGAPIVNGDTTYEMQHGDGTYYFYMLAKDTLGNWEIPPENADWWVELDTTPPTSHCISPKYATTLPFDVDYYSYDFPSSGVEETQLWFSFNGGAWTNSGLTEAGDYGTFSFSPGNGEGTYGLCTRALDSAGNLSDLPTSPHSTTIYDSSAPDSDCNCPATANYAPIAINYFAEDLVSGITEVRLYHRHDGGAWSDAGMFSTVNAGTTYYEGEFHYDPTQGDGIYDFYVIAQNNAGLWQTKAVADDSCDYTGTTPTSKADAPNYASDGTINFSTNSNFVPGIEVDYAAYTPGADLSEVTLWWRYEGGDWGEFDGDFGYTEPTGSVLFPFIPPHEEEGLYEFFTIAEDSNGLVEEAPPFDADSRCIYDITNPWSELTTIDEVSASTIYLDYLADDYREEGITSSGLHSVTLWYRYSGWLWHAAAPILGEATFGTIVFDINPASDGTIEFYTIARDNAGNYEATPPIPDDTTVFDAQAPQSWADPIASYYTSDPNITVDFTATDNLSGVAFVDLWYRYSSGNSPWTYSGLGHRQYTAVGSFNFVATEGIIEFYTIATDNFGNIEAAPGTADTEVCYDVTAPVSSILPTGDGEAYGSEPIPVYYMASDAVSGIANVSLYYRFNGGAWIDSVLSDTGTEGEYVFSPPHGAGTYEFYTIAEDNAGNVELAPTDDFHSALYDLQKPSSYAVGPLYTAVPDIALEYAASDDLGGIAVVGVWYRFGPGGWVPWLADYGDSTVGTIAMTLPYGEGNYYIFTQAADNAGNVEDWPVVHDIVTIYDAQEPESDCSCAEYSASSPIPVRYGANDPNSSGIAEVCLQYNFDGTGWEDSGLCETDPSGTFDFVPAEGPGVYQFRTLATDNSGNQETPSVADCQTTYDDEVPTSWCTCATVTTSSPISITFEADDAAGTLDSVALWVRYSADGGTVWDQDWQATGLSDASDSGLFKFNPTFGDGRYEFYTVATDLAGNDEAPSGWDCYSAYTASGPSSFASCPELWSGPNIPVSFTAGAPSGATVETVTLYWRRYVGPDYTSWHQYTDSYGSGTYGTIYFDYPVDEALYDFYTRAKQEGGVTEAPPSVADSSCQLDTIDPVSSCASSGYVVDVPIMVTFTASDASGTGINDVALWYDFNSSGTYTEYADHQTGTSGHFVFDPPSGQGSYGFYTIATDLTGNIEADPVTPPDTTTVWDVTKPTSEVTSVLPFEVTNATITVNFTCSDPVGNGVVDVGLWYNVDDGVWMHSGLDETGTNLLSGEFGFVALDGDGRYRFLTLAEDNWGNVQDPPAHLDPDDTCLVDSTAPESSCSINGYYFNSTPIDVDFVASDESGAGEVKGLDRTVLWYQIDGGAFTDSTLSSPDESGTFIFTPPLAAPDGDGQYGVYTISTDGLGNVEAVGSADDTFILDRQSPTSTATSPGCVNTPIIYVDYTADDAGPAGVDRVSLYYRYNAGAWALWGTMHADYGTFTFYPSQEGTYEFATYAMDNALNYEDFPGSLSDSATIYDATAPWSTCESPECANNEDYITVRFTAGDALIGVDSTALWARIDDGAWEDTGLTAPGTSGAYNWTIPYGFEGFVEFHTISTDNCGNLEAAPLDGFGEVTFDTQTTVDWTPPMSNCMVSEELVREPIVEVQWIATD